MTNHNLNEFRQAKIIEPHLNEILQSINLTYEKLSGFKSYLPVIKILKVLDEQKTFIELYKKKYSEILKNKAQINN